MFILRLQQNTLGHRLKENVRFEIVFRKMSESFSELDQKIFEQFLKGILLNQKTCSGHNPKNETIAFLEIDWKKSCLVVKASLCPPLLGPFFDERF